MVTLSPSTAQQAIKVWPNVVATSLTISAPTEVLATATFDVNANLSRADAKTNGLVGSTVRVVYVAGTTETPLGSISISTLEGTSGRGTLTGVKINTAGDYTLKAYFDGRDVTGFALAASRAVAKVRGATAKFLGLPLDIIVPAAAIVGGLIVAKKA